MNKNTPLDPRLVKEAAAWLARLNSGCASPADHHARKQWTSQSPEHERVWRLAQQLTGKFESIPAGLDVDIPVLKPTRRKAMKVLAISFAFGSSGWLLSHLPWRTWTATYQTATGERRSVALADGTRLTLNSASSVDIVQPGTQVWLRAGEILVNRVDSSQRVGASLVIHTPQGIVNVGGTRCSVRDRDGFTRVAALKGEMEVQPDAMRSGTHVVAQGQACVFSRDQVLTYTPASLNDEIWSQGLLFASNMRLSDFVSQLALNYRGVLRCSPQIADLRISGIYQVDKLDQILTFLTNTYPIVVHAVTRYWISLEPRSNGVSFIL